MNETTQEAPTNGRTGDMAKARMKYAAQYRKKRKLSPQMKKLARVLPDSKSFRDAMRKAGFSERSNTVTIKNNAIKAGIYEDIGNKLQSEVNRAIIELSTRDLSKVHYKDLTSSMRTQFEVMKDARLEKSANNIENVNDIALLSDDELNKLLCEASSTVDCIDITA